MVPSWAHQGMGPTDADARSGELRAEDLGREWFVGGNQAVSSPSQYISGGKDPVP
jgi:hypothetical protein